MGNRPSANAGTSAFPHLENTAAQSGPRSGDAISNAISGIVPGVAPDQYAEDGVGEAGFVDREGRKADVTGI